MWIQPSNNNINNIQSGLRGGLSSQLGHGELKKKTDFPALLNLRKVGFPLGYIPECPPWLGISKVYNQVRLPNAERGTIPVSVPFEKVGLQREGDFIEQAPKTGFVLQLNTQSHATQD